jgi:glycosyltransferase involved in cell wall biosynthesis
MKLSVIIPCYNEKKTIKKIIDKIFAQKINLEIILVDDGSDDGTVDVIKNYKTDSRIKIVFHLKNKGKGAAIKSSVKFITGDLVLIQDADLEYNPKDYKKILDKFKEDKNVKAVYGSRALNNSNYQGKITLMRIIRIIANRILTLFSNFINSQHLTDAHTCYKSFRAEIFKKINLKENDFSFCAEVNAKLSTMNVNIKEVPISYNGRTIAEGKKIKLIDFFLAIKTTIKYRFFN